MNPNLIAKQRSDLLEVVKPVLTDMIARPQDWKDVSVRGPTPDGAIITSPDASKPVSYRVSHIAYTSHRYFDIMVTRTSLTLTLEQLRLDFDFAKPLGDYPRGEAFVTFAYRLGVSLNHAINTESQPRIIRDFEYTERSFEELPDYFGKFLASICAINDSSEHERARLAEEKAKETAALEDQLFSQALQILAGKVK